jgi:hypothetical protein
MSTSYYFDRSIRYADLIICLARYQVRELDVSTPASCDRCWQVIKHTLGGQEDRIILEVRDGWVKEILVFGHGAILGIIERAFDTSVQPEDAIWDFSGEREHRELVAQIEQEFTKVCPELLGADMKDMLLRLIDATVGVIHQHDRSNGVAVGSYEVDRLKIFPSAGGEPTTPNARAATKAAQELFAGVEGRFKK